MFAGTVKRAPYTNPGYTMGYCPVGGSWKLRNVGEPGIPEAHELSSFPEWISQLDRYLP